MTTVVKAGTPAALLGLVPAMLGYQPESSVVYVAMNGTRSVGAMRFDIPAPGDEKPFAATSIGLLCRIEQIDRMIVITYANDRQARVHAAIQEHARNAGLGIVDSLFVTDAVFGLHTDPVSTVQPISSIELNPNLPVVTARNTVPALPAPVQDVDVHTELQLSPTTSLVRFIDSIASDGVPDDLSADDVSRFLRIAVHPLLREAMLHTLIGGPELGNLTFQAQSDLRNGGVYPEGLSEVLKGKAPRPEHQRFENVLELARIAAASSSDEYRQGALSVCAWISWATGYSTRALGYIAMGAVNDLSTTVEQLVHRSVLPDWMFESNQTEEG
ncbi:MAG TPA: DUF4192 family protein [Candidatus Lumbricidophila sp.]|nr:DUF4192 family protein [Candidatus Lumbricidophila sp.]